MYVCNDCGMFFEEEKVNTESVGEFWGAPAYQEYGVCPYCKSTDCKKISGLSKAGSVALWGIFALGKTTKQFHCNNCKADF